MAKSPIRVAVTGAAGNIGYALLFRIASGQMFGADQPLILQLLEIPVEGPQKALKGVAMELDDCAFPLLQSMVLTGDADVAFKDVNWALLVGCKPRGTGMDAASVIGDEAWLKSDFLPAVGKRGAAIIEARGVSSAASAANALVDHVRDLVTPGKVHSVAVESQGRYGFADGVWAGMPVR